MGNLTAIKIYLLNRNLSYNRYILNSNYQKQYISISKSKMGSKFHSGIIYIFSKSSPRPSWAKTVENMATKESKKKIKFNKNTDYNAIAFLKVNVPMPDGTKELKTFAVTFGRSYNLLNPEFIENDFADITTRKLVSDKSVTTLNSVTLDHTIFKTKKNASKSIPRTKLLNNQELSFVKDLYGKTELKGKEITLGGNKSLNLRGSIQFNNPDFVNLLVDLGEVYFSTTEKKFNIKEMLIPVKNTATLRALNKILMKKLTDLSISTNGKIEIHKRLLKGISLEIPEPIPVSNITNVFITGIGYKRTSSYKNSELNALDFFERLRSLNLSDSESVLRKIKNAKIEIIIDDDPSLNEVFSVFNSLTMELTLKNVNYLLFNGNWYEINNSFHQNLIDELQGLVNAYTYTPEPSYPSYSPTKKEEIWTADFAACNADITNFDQKFYNFNLKQLKEYGLNTHSKIEICDAFRFNDQFVEFTHAKKKGGASGISHLANQAVASGTLFNEQTDKIIEKINTLINPKFNLGGHKKLVKFIVLDSSFKDKEVHKVFTILEAIALIQGARALKDMGYEVTLKPVW